MSPRKYEQRARAATAEATRREVLDAVVALLHEQAAGPLSLDQVAKRAGVARSTVYTSFGSRQALFEAVAEDLAERTGLARLTEAVADPDAREHLRRGMRAGLEMFANDREVWRALQSMAALDPSSLGAAAAVLDERRAGGMAYLAKRLAEQGVLRPDVTEAEAADVLWVLTSFDAYDLLATGRDLPFDEVVARLVTTAERTLCT